MSESFIEPDSLNTTFQSLSAIIDDDGATRFLNQELSSYNFDGFIPVETDTIKVNELEPGYLFLPVGESTGTLRAVLKVEFDDPEMTDSPTTNYIISYLGPDGDVQTVTYDANDDIEIYREDWDNKILGNTGWTITQAGNAIFSNVAVRGRIEAQEGFLENLGITGILTMEAGGTINIGTNPGTAGNAGIVINESGIFAYDDNETSTFSIDAATGEIIIGALDEAIENIEEELENFVTPEDLISGSYVTNAKLVDGVTRISGTNIQTGTVNANLVNVVNINAGNINTGALNANLITTGALSGWTIDTSKIYTSQMTFDSFNSRISVGPTNSPIGILEKDIAGTGISLRCDATTTAYGGTFPLARIDVTDAGSTAYGGIKLQAVEFFGRGGSSTIELIGQYPTAYCNITAPFINLESTFGTNLIYGFSVKNSSFTTVAGCSSTGVFTGDGSGLTNIPAPTSIPASSITSGTLADARIPNLAASKITSGTFDDARIPNLAASKITSGVFARARVENVQETGFTNSQTPLQVRTSDGRVGTFSSTISIKENILPLTGIQSSVVPKEKNGIGKSSLKTDPENIFNITPVEYSIVNEDDSVKEVGFIVEDLLEKWPSAVTYDKNGNPQSYNTNSIVAGLIYAVSTLKNKVEELQGRVVELESSMETQNEQL